MPAAMTRTPSLSTGPVSIRQEDLIQSVADALQYISYYHPVDYIRNLSAAYEREESPAAKDAIAQILINSRMCAEGHRPICQDTGIVTVFLEIGMDVRWDDATMGVEDMVHEGVRRAYNHPDNKLRASVLADPAGKRTNTRDNTPGVVNVKVVPGNTVEVIVAAKGGGSEAKSKFAMLNPSDSIVDWVLKTVPTMGAGWCPPGMLGIGIGGTAEKAMLMAKEALMEPIDMAELKARGPKSKLEELRIEIEKAQAQAVTLAQFEDPTADPDATNIEPAITLPDLERVLLEVPASREQLREHPDLDRVWLVKDDQNNKIAVTFDREVLDANSPDVRLLTYGDSILDSILQRAGVPTPRR